MDGLEVSFWSSVHIKQKAEHTVVIHSNDLSHLLHLGSDNQSVKAGELCRIQDLLVVEMILPMNAKGGTKGNIGNSSSCLMCHQYNV